MIQTRKGHTFTFRFGFLADGHQERGTSLSPSRRSTERDNSTMEESDGDEESTETNADCFIVGGRSGDRGGVVEVSRERGGVVEVSR